VTGIGDSNARGRGGGGDGDDDVASVWRPSTFELVTPLLAMAPRTRTQSSSLVYV
jgi:hypothetical protein